MGLIKRRKMMKMEFWLEMTVFSSMNIGFMVTEHSGYWFLSIFLTYQKRMSWEKLIEWNKYPKLLKSVQLRTNKFCICFMNIRFCLYKCQKCLIISLNINFSYFSHFALRETHLWLVCVLSCIYSGSYVLHENELAWVE